MKSFPLLVRIYTQAEILAVRIVGKLSSQAFLMMVIGACASAGFNFMAIKFFVVESFS
jgi:hypothetical protein